MTTPPGSPQPRYILEKRPNLLSYTLTVPLVAKDAPEEEARLISTRLGQSAARPGVAPGPSRFPSPVAPSLRVTKRKDGSCLVTIVAPFQGRGQVSEFLTVTLDTHVDVDRSTLTLHGDHLAARLAFSDFSKARDARLEREAKRPGPSEFDLTIFEHQGLQCRRCKNPVVHPGVCRRVHRHPKLPWAELLDSLTCVRPEDYRESETIDRAFQYSIDGMIPETGIFLIGETHISVNASDLSHSGICKEPVLNRGSFDLDNGGTSKSWIRCGGCSAWLGEEISNGADSHKHEARIFKFGVRAGHAFEEYQSRSVLCGFIAEAALVRECYRFLVTSSTNAVLQLVLMSYDSWVRTESMDIAQPALKFMYKTLGGDDQAAALSWGKRNAAEIVCIPSTTALDELITELRESTLAYPHSCRRFPDGTVVGFLLW